MAWINSSPSLAPHFTSLISEYDHTHATETETQMTFTSEIFDQMMTDDRWLGFGYLGERRSQLATGRIDSVAEADALILTRARERGLTYEQIFTWANSKNGRWFGDCYFGSHTHHHTTDYLPR